MVLFLFTSSLVQFVLKQQHTFINKFARNAKIVVPLTSWLPFPSLYYTFPIWCMHNSDETNGMSAIYFWRRHATIKSITIVLTIVKRSPVYKCGYALSVVVHSSSYWHFPLTCDLFAYEKATQWNRESVSTETENKKRFNWA